MKFQEPKWILRNILVTAVEGFLVAWAATGNKTDKATLGAAVGAGLSAAWNIVLKPALKTIGWL